MLRIPRIAPALGVGAALLAAPAGAAAHVTVQPEEAVPGGYDVISVRVPNESDDAATTKVDVKLPPGFVSAAYQKVPGWKARVVTTTRNPPVEVEGTPVREQIDRVIFTASSASSGVRPGQFQDFPLSVRIPDGKPGAKLTFKAVQTYEGGEKVRWIGAPDAEQPAPQLTLVEGKAESDGHSHGGDEAEDTADGQDDDAVAAVPAAAASTGDDDDGPSTGLVIVALALGALGLGTGLTALLAARRGAAS